MIIGVFIYFIAMVSFLHKNDNKYAIWILILSWAIFKLIGDNVLENSGKLYYISAALTDAIIVNLLGKLKKISILILQLQAICICYICTNLIGFILYELYYEAIFYDVTCTILIVLTLLTVTQKGSDHELGTDTNYKYNHYFCGSDTTISTEIQKN